MKVEIVMRTLGVDRMPVTEVHIGDKVIGIRHHSCGLCVNVDGEKFIVANPQYDKDFGSAETIGIGPIRVVRERLDTVMNVEGVDAPVDGG